jgi:SAM-dependent methyltransferase
MKKACIACGESKQNRLWGSLERCASCGLVRAREIPSDKELARLYQEEYFFGKEYFDYQADRPALEHNFAKRLKTLNAYMSKTTNLVEVGCAYGFFLNLVKTRVGHHRGYDVSEDGITFARKQLGVNASTDDFVQARITPSSVDIVCMWDVIEHLPRPEEYIKKVGEVLKPGGVLALTTGDISGWVARRRGPKWRMIHPPTHLYYFAPDTLAKLLERYGLKLVRVNYPATYRNLGSVINQIKLNRRAQRKWSKPFEWLDVVAARTGLHRLNLPLNTYDIMEVVARKS